jgi:hypothetical protein
MADRIAAAVGSDGTVALSDGRPMIVQVAQGKAAELADRLLAAGARRVTVASADYIFAADDPLTSRLMQRLGRG